MPVSTSVSPPSHRQTADEEKLLALLTNEVDPKPPVGRNADVFSSTQVPVTSTEPVSARETEDDMAIGRRDNDKSVVLVSQIHTTFSLLKSLCIWC